MLIRHIANGHWLCLAAMDRRETGQVDQKKMSQKLFLHRTSISQSLHYERNLMQADRAGKRGIASAYSNEGLCQAVSGLAIATLCN
jgi:hypothetical protein